MAGREIIAARNLIVDQHIGLESLVGRQIRIKHLPPNKARTEAPARSSRKAHFGVCRLGAYGAPTAHGILAACHAPQFAFGNDRRRSPSGGDRCKCRDHQEVEEPPRGDLSERSFSALGPSRFAQRRRSRRSRGGLLSVAKLANVQNLHSFLISSTIT